MPTSRPGYRADLEARIMEIEAQLNSHTRFADDIVLPRMAFGRLLRSTEDVTLHTMVRASLDDGQQLLALNDFHGNLEVPSGTTTYTAAGQQLREIDRAKTVVLLEDGVERSADRGAEVRRRACTTREPHR